MSGPLFKRHARELKNNPGKYLGLFFMIAFAVAFTSGFLLAASSIEKICLEMGETYKVEDGRFICDFEPDEKAIAAVEKLGVKVYGDHYKTLEAQLSGADGEDLTAKVRLYAGRTEVNLAAYASGEQPVEADEVALDRVFMENHGISVGDVLQVGGRTCTVVGCLTLPDYQALFEDNGDFMFNAQTFAVGIASQEAYDTFASAAQSYCYSFTFDDPSLDLAKRTDIEEDMIEALSENDASLNMLLDAEDNQGIGYALDDVEGDQMMWTVLLMMLIVIMGFVFVILTGSTIEAESSVIGTLLASGWKRRELVAHYLFLPALVGLIAVVCGLCAGLTLLSDPMKNLYYNSYSLPPYVQSWNWSVVFITAVVPYMLLVGITAAGLLRKLKFSPLQFLRHEAMSSKHRGNVRLPQTLPYAVRFRLRVLLRNAGNFVTLFFGILFASLLLLFGTSLLPVVDNYAKLLKESVPVAFQYMLKVPVELQGSEQDVKRYAAVLRLVEDHGRLEANEEAVDAAERLEDNDALLDALRRLQKNDELMDALERLTENEELMDAVQTLQDDGELVEAAERLQGRQELVDAMRRLEGQSAVTSAALRLQGQQAVVDAARRLASKSKLQAAATRLATKQKTLAAFERLAGKPEMVEAAQRLSGKRELVAAFERLRERADVLDAAQRMAAGSATQEDAALLAQAGEQTLADLETIKGATEQDRADIELVATADGQTAADLETAAAASAQTRKDIELVQSASKRERKDLQIVASASSQTLEDIETLSKASQRTLDDIELVSRMDSQTQHDIDLLQNAGSQARNALELLAGASQQERDDVELVAGADEQTREDIELIADADAQTRDDLETLRGMDADLLDDLRLASEVDEDAHVVNTQANSPQALQAAEKMAVGSVEVERLWGGKYETVTVYGVRPDSSYWSDIPVQDGFVVASAGLVEKTKAQVGESVEVADRRQGKVYSVSVGAQTQNAADVALYMTLRDFNELFGNDGDYFNAYASSEALNIDERYVARTVVPDDMDKISNQMQDSMGSIANMMLVMAVPIYLVIVYLLTKTVIGRSARSISYMKVFGYRDREVDGLYIRPVSIAVVVSLVLSLPIVIGLLAFLLKAIFMSYSGNFTLVVPQSRLVLVVGVGLAAYVLVACLHVRSIRRVPLSLALKIQE